MHFISIVEIHIVWEEIINPGIFSMSLIWPRG
jgi:hypothetical protein